MASGMKDMTPEICLPTGPVWEAAKLERNWLVAVLRQKQGETKLGKLPTLDGEHPVDRNAAAKLTFAEAVAKQMALNCVTGSAVGADGYCVLGYFPRAGSKLRALDWDKCRDPATGEVLDPEVESVLARRESYFEVSPSGTGIRGWISASTQGADAPGSEANGFGYSGTNGKFFTFTGDKLRQSADEIGVAPLALGRTLALGCGGRGTPKGDRSAWDGPVEPVDEQSVTERLSVLLAADGPFQRLWGGDRSELDDQSLSGADFAVIGALRRGGFSPSETLHAMLNEYQQESRCIEDWRKGEERQFRRAVGRAPLRPRAEDEFEPVIQSGDWIDPGEHESPDLNETWRVDDLLPIEGLGMLYGPSGTGKTFTAIDLGLCISNGRPWMGRETEPCPVVYVASEGGRSAARNRIVAWHKYHGLPRSDMFHCIACNFDLLGNVDQVLSTIEARGVAPGVIVIDTLNQNMGSGDENSTQDTTKLIVALQRLRRGFSGLVLVIHHTGKDASRGPRGSSTLFAAMDAVLELESASARRDIKLTKNRHGPEGSVGNFVLHQVELGLSPTGKSVCSAVMRNAGARSLGEQEAIGRKRKAMARRSSWQIAAAEALEKLALAQGEFGHPGEVEFDAWRAAASELDLPGRPEGPKAQKQSLQKLGGGATPLVDFLPDGTVRPLFARWLPIWGDEGTRDLRERY